MGHGVSGRCGQVVLNSSDIVSLPFVLLYIKIFLSLLSKKKKKMQYILLGSLIKKMQYILLGHHMEKMPHQT